MTTDNVTPLPDSGHGILPVGTPVTILAQGWEGPGTVVDRRTDASFPYHVQRDRDGGRMSGDIGGFRRDQLAVRRPNHLPVIPRLGAGGLVAAGNRVPPIPLPMHHGPLAVSPLNPVAAAKAMMDAAASHRDDMAKRAEVADAAFRAARENWRREVQNIAEPPGDPVLRVWDAKSMRDVLFFRYSQNRWHPTGAGIGSFDHTSKTWEEVVGWLQSRGITTATALYEVGSYKIEVPRV